MALAFVVVAPVELIVMGIGAGRLSSGFESSDAATFLDLGAQLLITTPLVSAVVVGVMLALDRGERPTFGSVLERALTQFAPLLAVVLMFSGGVLLGMLALVIPGVYLAVRWMVAMQALLVEGHRGGAALRRSGELVSGSWWRVLGVGIVVNLVAGLLGAVLYLPLAAAAEAADSGALDLAGGILSQSISAPIVTLGTTLLFFDLRARREGEPAGAGDTWLPERPEAPPPA